MVQRFGKSMPFESLTLPDVGGEKMLENRNRIWIALLTVALISPAAAMSSVDGAQSPWDSAEDGQYPTEVTRSVKLVVKEINPNGSVVFLDTEREESVAVQITEKVDLTAKKKKDFGGRKKLEFADLAVGQIVKLRYRTSDGEILSIQVIGQSQRT